MRFFRNNDTAVAVRWYRCQAGAELMPHHSFGSLNWATDRAKDSPLGEVARDPRPWNNGATIPGAVGHHYCGTNEEWLRGIVYPPAAPMEYDVNGLATCCPGAGPPPTEDDVRDINFWKHVATPSLNRWYVGGSMLGNPTLTTVPIETDTLVGLPFFPSRGGTLGAMGVWVQLPGSGGTKMRVALYDSVSDTDLSPNNLIFDSGDLDTDAAPPSAWLSVPCNIVLDKTRLYWLFYVGTAVPFFEPQVGAVSRGDCMDIWGVNDFDLLTRAGVAVVNPFGPFPPIFPAIVDGDLAVGDPIGAVGVQYSA